MRVNKHFLAIIALFIIGLAVRCLPLLFSGLPFNIDGFPLVRISEDIINTGHWSLSYPEGTSDLVLYNNKLPVLSLLISTFSLIFGRTPMETAQVIIPFLSSTAIVIIYVIAFKITKNEMVSFFAGLALALNGFYVYLGSAVMKQTVGMVLLLLTIYLYQGRDDAKKRILASMLLLLLAMTHHLTVWIGFVTISLLMLTSNALQWHHGTFKKKRFTLDLIFGPALFIFIIGYYHAVNLPFFTSVSSLNDVALFASIFLIGAIFCIMFSLPKRRKKPARIIFNKTLLIPIIGIALLLLNYYINIFDTVRTTKTLLLYLVPYLLLCAIGIIGLNVVASKKTDYKPFFAALLLGPLLIIAFAIVRGLDAFSFILVYRSYDYIDFGLAICAGIGVGYIINRMTKRLDEKENTHKASFRLKAAISITFFVICLSTVPLAHHGQEFYGVQDVTYRYELNAMSWLDENGADYHISTDERSKDIMNPYFDLECDLTLPWKLDFGEAVESGTILFVEDKWTITGAQMSPMEPIKISKETFSDMLEKNDVIYTTGPSGSQIYIVMVR